MKKIIEIMAICLCINVFAGGCAKTEQVSQEELKYQMAEQLYEENEYEEAAALFKALSPYQDSNEKYEQSMIKKANELFSDGEYNQVIELLAEVDSEEARQVISDAYFELGNQKLDEEKYADAISEYEQSSRTDAQDQIKECNYQIAVGYYMSGDYESAQKLFKDISGYRDAVNLYDECSRRIEASREFINVKYTVNQSDEEFEGIQYQNGEGKLRFLTDEPFEDWVGSGGYDGYVTYCVPESQIHLSLENTSDQSVSNLCVRLDFSGVILQYVDEPFVAENHIHGIGGYGSAVLYPGTLNGRSESSIYTLYMSEAFFENRQNGILTITVSGDNYPARSYDIPLELK